jgi:hypothetical protein
MNKEKITFYVSAYLKTYIEGLLYPLFNLEAFIRILIIPISLYLTFIFQGLWETVSEISSVIKLFLSFLIAAPIWALINIPLSVFRTYAKIKSLGEWHDNSFIFKHPIHIKTISAHAGDHQKTILFKCPYALKKSRVKFKIEYDGGTAIGFVGNSKLEMHGWSKKNGYNRNTDYEERIDNNKQAKIGIIFPDNSDMTIMKIYALYFKI